MSIVIKGITNLETINQLKPKGVSDYFFDLRPKSFNFVQAKRIKSFISENTHLQYGLIFENEKDFVVNGLFDDIYPLTSNLLLEFTGASLIGELENLEKNYTWIYHQGETLRNISSSKYLKRLVIHHRELEKFHASGELFGFLQLFSDLKDKIEIELQLDWDTQLIMSMFEYFDFDKISLEINQKVEKSYQNVDNQLIISHIDHMGLDSIGA